MAKESASEKSARSMARAQVIAAIVAAVATVFAALIGGWWIWMKPTDSKPETSAKINSGSNSQNINIQGMSGGTLNIPGRGIGDEKTNAIDGQPPPPLPTTFPGVKGFGIAPLTDEQRNSKFYRNSIVELSNQCETPIRLAISFAPHASSVPESSISKYVHRITTEVLPGEVQEKEMEYFGGAVHISVLADGKWHPMNQWFDMGIVATRTIEVSRDSKGFVCRVAHDEASK